MTDAVKNLILAAKLVRDELKIRTNLKYHSSISAFDKALAALEEVPAVGEDRRVSQLMDDKRMLLLAIKKLKKDLLWTYERIASRLPSESTQPQGITVTREEWEKLKNDIRSYCEFGNALDLMRTIEQRGQG